MTPSTRPALAAALLLAGLAESADTERPAQTEGRSSAVEVDEAAATLTDALQGKDGVRIQTLCTHCNSANVQVGGLSEDLVPMSRDGFPLVGGLATTFVLNILPADTIAAAEVVKGPGGAGLSSTAAGGAISLSSSIVEEVPLFGVVAETGSFSLRRAATRLAGAMSSRATADLVLGTTRADAIDADGDGWVDVPDVDRGYAEGGVTLTPVDDHTVWLGVSHIDEDNVEARGAYDPFRAFQENRDAWTREDTFFDRVELRAGWRWELDAASALDLRLLQADRGQLVRSQASGLAAIGPIQGTNRLVDRFDIDENDRWGRVAYERSLGMSCRVEAGAEVSSRRVDAANLEPLAVVAGTQSVPQLATETVDLVSGFTDFRWKPSPSWDVQLGLRYDRADLFTELTSPPEILGGAPERKVVDRSFDETSPRLTVRYFPAAGWTLRLVAGRTFRTPSPILAAVCCGQNYQTTEKVVPERGTTVGWETAWVPTPRFRASAYVARTRFDDHILRLVGWSQALIQTYALANVPDATADRAELSLGWSPVRRLDLDASMSWLSFENRGPRHVPVFVVAPSQDEPRPNPIAIDRMPYRPRSLGSIAARWTAPRDVVLFGRAAYTGNMEIQEFTEGNGLSASLNTEGMRRTPGFWLVDLAGEIPLTRRVRLLAALDNLTDRVQNDLGDPATDYNWGPLTGRAWRLGVKFDYERRR